MWCWNFNLGLSRAPSSELGLERERTLTYVKSIKDQRREKILGIVTLFISIRCNNRSRNGRFMQRNLDTILASSHKFVQRHKLCHGVAILNTIKSHHYPSYSKCHPIHCQILTRAGMCASSKGDEFPCKSRELEFFPSFRSPCICIIAVYIFSMVKSMETTGDNGAPGDEYWGISVRSSSQGKGCILDGYACHVAHRWCNAEGLVDNIIKVFQPLQIASRDFRELKKVFSKFLPHMKVSSKMKKDIG